VIPGMKPRMPTTRNTIPNPSARFCASVRFIEPPEIEWRTGT
jgi:hypothetical protein